ncbi:MAG: hypothetical protein AAF196_12825 [Planctomycetota bacterium]
MIAGPILPRTAESLRGLVLEDATRLESGMRVLRESLVLGDGGQIDLLARDAAGRAVLLFCVGHGEDRSLAAHVVNATEWWREHRSLMSRVVPELGDRMDRAPRVLVLGFSYSSDGLERLRATRLDGLEILRVEVFQVGGETHIGVLSALRGSAAPPKPEPFELPEPFVDGLDRERESQIRRFLDDLRRMEPNLSSDGDRYRRRFFFRGEPLLELWRGDLEMQVRIEGRCRGRLGAPEDASKALDAAMRRYLDLLDGLDVGCAEAGPESESSSIEARDSDLDRGPGPSSPPVEKPFRGAMAPESMAPESMAPESVAPESTIAAVPVQSPVSPAQSQESPAQSRGRSVSPPVSTVPAGLSDLGPLSVDDQLEAKLTGRGVSAAAPKPVAATPAPVERAESSATKVEAVREAAEASDHIDLVALASGLGSAPIPADELDFETDDPESADTGSLASLLDEDPEFHSIDPELLDGLGSGLGAPSFGRIEDAELTDDELGAFFEMDDDDDEFFGLGDD